MCGAYIYCILSLNNESRKHCISRAVLIYYYYCQMPTKNILKYLGNSILRNSDSRTGVIFCILIFVFSFFVYLTTWHGAFTGYEIEAMRGADALLRGSFQFTRAGLGMTLLYTPFLLLQKLFSIENNNFLTLAIIFYSALTNIVIFLLLKKLFKNIYAALLVSALLATSSMIWPYANIGMEYPSALFLALTLLALLNYEQNGRGLILVGLALGFLTATKAYNILLFIPAAAYLFWTLKEKGQIKKIINPAFLASVMLPIILLYGPSVFYNLFVYKSVFGAYSAAEFKISDWWEGFYGLFFSVGKSIFIFNPLLIIAAFFWPKFLQDRAKAAWFIILSFAILLLLNAPLASWSDETWGPRKLLPVILLLHLPLIYCLRKLKNKFFFIIFFCLSFAAIYVQFLGAAYFYGSQLKFLKNANLDPLQNMRYIPQMSHPILYNKFFTSYLGRLKTGQSADFVYYESVWAKRENGIAFELYPKIKIDLRPYERLYTIWSRETENYNSAALAAKKKILLAFFATASSLLFCLIIYFYKKRPS